MTDVTIFYRNACNLIPLSLPHMALQWRKRELTFSGLEGLAGTWRSLARKGRELKMGSARIGISNR